SGQVAEKSWRRVARLLQGPKSMRIQVEERSTVVDAGEVKLILGILEGAFAPGARLPGEAGLGRELGVSRGALRSALSRLISRGLLKASQGRQTRVSELGEFATLDTLLTRLIGRPTSSDSRNLFERTSRSAPPPLCHTAHAGM